MSQEQKKKSTDNKKDEITEVPATKKDTAKKSEEIKKDLDELMDKIDDVLEENAEEFLKNYVQKGGQAVIFILGTAYLISQMGHFVIWIS